MSTAPLSIHNVSKTFKPDVRASQDISFSLESGEIFGLVGVNGAGKTTLVKMILGLQPKDAGTIEIFDVPCEEPASRSQLAYLPEKYMPPRHLTGHEVLEISRAYYGKPYQREEGHALATALDMPPEKLSERVKSLSKGTGQKLGLMAALLQEAPLLVLDEPMSGLDPLARVKFKQQLLARRKAGATVFFSSHILADVEEICDRLAVIHQGQLRFLGTPAALMESTHETSLERAFLKAVNTA